MCEIDFDELEKVEALQAQSPEDPRGFKELFCDALESGRYHDFSTLIVQEVEAEDGLDTRLSAVAKTVLDLFLTALKSPDRAAERAPLAYVLFQLAMSTSLHKVRCAAAAADSQKPLCVLIFGFAGSSVEELEPQVAWYQSQGHAVLAAGPCKWPAKLQEKQDSLIVEQLLPLLRAGDRSLVLHMCSNGGVFRAASFVGRWARGEAEFGALPALEECLAGFVFECAPARPLDPSGEVLGSPQPKPPVEAPKRGPARAFDSEASIPPEMLAEAGFLKMVIIGCVGALCRKYAPSFSFFELLTECPAAEASIAEAGFGVVAGGPDWAVREEPWRWDLPEMEAWDFSLPSAVPRLFLFSRRDSLVSREKVEAYIRYTQRHNPKAKVLTACLQRSPHCKLWATEPAACAEAVARLLARVAQAREAQGG